MTKRPKPRRPRLEPMYLVEGHTCFGLRWLEPSTDRGCVLYDPYVKASAEKWIEQLTWWHKFLRHNRPVIIKYRLRRA